MVVAANSALFIVFKGALVHEIGVDATLLVKKIANRISLPTSHECLIDVNNLARREQDEADEPKKGNYDEDEAPDFGGIATIVSIYPKL